MQFLTNKKTRLNKSRLFYARQLFYECKMSFTHKIAVSEKDTTSYHRKEISEYSSTSFYIGEDITQNDIKAKYENGILSLTIPKLQPRITEKSYIAIE